MSEEIGVDLADDVGARVEPGPMVPIPVLVEGSALARTAPATFGAFKAANGITSAVAVRLLPKDPRRKRVQILASGQPIQLGGTQAQAQAPTAAVLPTGLPLTIEGTFEIWAMSATSGQAANVSLFVESWT